MIQDPLKRSLEDDLNIWSRLPVFEWETLAFGADTLRIPKLACEVA
jgi:hypothetical protein